MRMDRRQFLAAAVAAPVVGRARIRRPPVIDRGFARVERVAEGVYVTFAVPGKGPQCLSNGGVIVGRDATLVVEGHFQPEGAAFEIELARGLSRVPIRGAVNTHFHLDHTFGNAAYARERLAIIAHERAPGLMQTTYAAVKGADHTRHLEPLAQRVARAATPVERKRFEADLGANQWMYGAIDAVQLAYPTELVKQAEGRLRIDLGGLVAVVEAHQGHTPGDLTVTVPARKVAFVGDLLFHREYPVAIDADMAAWRRLLSRFERERSGMRLVPGHGPLCGVEAVREQAALFDDLHAHAERMRRAGADVEEAERRYVVPARFRSHAIFSWNWTIGAALRSYYSRS